MKAKFICSSVMLDKSKRYEKRFIKIVDFPNFLETFWEKVMKRKSKVYGPLYPTVPSNIWPCNFIMIMLCWHVRLCGENEWRHFVTLATWRWLRNVVQIVLFVLKMMYCKYFVFSLLYHLYHVRMTLWPEYFVNNFCIPSLCK